MTEPKRHHYVPRSYLRNFANTSKQVAVYDVRRRREFRTHVKNVAVERGFYELRNELDAEEFDDDIPEEMLGRNRVEKWLSKVEGEAKSLLYDLRRRAISAHRMKGFYPTVPGKWREDLAYIVYLQYMRTREQRQRYRDFSESFQTAIARMITEASPDFDDAETTTEDVVIRLNDDEVRPHHIRQMLDPDILKKIVSTWRDEWYFYVARAPRRSPYFTSDAAVVAHNHLGGARGLLSEGMEFQFPLAPYHALLLVEPTIGREMEPVLGIKDGDLMYQQPENVTFHNSLHVLGCYAQIYSTNEDFSLVREMLDENPKLGTDEWDAEQKGVLVNGERIV